MSKLKINIWSDVACPWCHVGKRRLEAALAGFEHRDHVSVTWRAFELDPSAPAVQDATPHVERLAKKYGKSVSQAQAMMDGLTATARADGLAFRFDRIQSGNTFDAHRLLHLAHLKGIQDAVKERFLLGYLSEGKAIGETHTLSQLAVDAGLSPDDVASLLGSDLYARDVREDESQARELGTSGVPFFVIGRFALSGAQPTEVLLRVLEKAWGETEDQARVADGASCGVDGCL